MPLARARCPACTLPLGDPPPATLSVTCGRCARANLVPVAADGQPADLDPAFTAGKLLSWLASARVAMASGTPGVAVGACTTCGSPLAISSRDPVSLPCPHCAQPVAGTAAERIVDQWMEPWARVEGGGIDLEYRLAMLEEKHGATAGCAACGGPTPPNDPSDRCARCGAVAWVTRPGGRFQLGVRIDGTRDERPFKVLVSIVQGEALLRADAMRGTTGRSGRSLLGATGIGCASAAAVIVLLVLGIWIAVHFAHC
ncbi:MAG TPA: hypothetical protein VGG39_26670 [Polyangiaceae bacterium]|jgi:hypothetical protein